MVLLRVQTRAFVQRYVESELEATARRLRLDYANNVANAAAKLRLVSEKLLELLAPPVTEVLDNPSAVEEVEECVITERNAKEQLGFEVKRDPPSPSQSPPPELEEGVESHALHSSPTLWEAPQVV